MKNNWKYSTLSAAEKLMRIGKGDTDLFDSEMRNTANYASLLKESGLDNSFAVNYMKNLAIAANPQGMFGSFSANNSESLLGEQASSTDGTSAMTSGNELSDTKSESKSSSVFPKYYSGNNLSEAQRALNDLTKALGDYNRSLKELDEQNEKAEAYVSEWLVNNGYSLDGSLGTKSLGKLESDYEAQSKALKKKYKAASGSAYKYLGIKDIID